MLDIVWALLAVAANAAGDGGGGTAQVAPKVEAAPSVTIGEEVTLGEGVTVGGAAPAPAPADASVNSSVIPPGLVAEPQTPTGRLTTAAEIKPILNATKSNWVAVREYDGKDLLYVTHLWSWRCGLAAMAISVNDEPMQNWPLPACHLDSASPNAILEQDGLPYLTMRLGSVEKITIQVVYDDLSVDVASFDRGSVLMP